jgi:excinuclease UvrABC nuclease subunit
MNSDTLQASGFTSWMLFNRANARPLIDAAPSTAGVYVIRCRTPFPRALGTSDVLYVGSARNRDGLRMRLRQYFHPGPTQRTNQRMLARCGDSTDYEVSYVTCDSANAAVRLEAEILARYVSEHGELPPENRVLPSGSAAL